MFNEIKKKRLGKSTSRIQLTSLLIKQNELIASINEQ